MTLNECKRLYSNIIWQLFNHQFTSSLRALQIFHQAQNVELIECTNQYRSLLPFEEYFNLAGDYIFSNRQFRIHSTNCLAITKRFVVQNRPMRLASLLGGEFHALLLLPLVAEPDADDVLLEVELLGDGGDLLTGRARLDGEVGLERALLRSRDRRPLALLLAGRKNRRRFRISPLVASLRLGLFQPRVKDRLQRYHVVVRQRQRFKPIQRKFTIFESIIFVNQHNILYL